VDDEQGFQQLLFGFYPNTECFTKYL